MPLITYQPLIAYNRTYQESLMGDACVVWRGANPIEWPREETIVVPCRVGEERTLSVSADPADANTRTQNEWVVNMPWDMPVQAGDKLVATFAETGGLLSAIVGETNLPQSWAITARAVAAKPKIAVQALPLTFKRDADGDGTYETIVGTFQVAVVIDRVDPLEVPMRYSQAGRTSYVFVRLVFPDVPDVPVQIDDIFLYEGMYGVVFAVTPNDTQQTEARALIDFGRVA